MTDNNMSGRETLLFYSETLYKYTLRDWLKKLASLFHPIRSETETKILLAHTRFSRAWRQPHEFTSSFDWFTGLSVSFVIG